MDDKTRFLITNLIKGLAWLAVLIGLLIYAKNKLNFDFFELISPISEKPFLIFSIFFASEVVFGIIPPEIFMFWSLRNGLVSHYVGNIITLSVLSYISGYIGFFIGSYLNQTRLYRILKINFLGKYERLLNKYGGFLLIVAALTPLPFSGICMLIGAVKYPIRKFFTFTLFRFLRFIVYSYIIWEANIFTP
ncbi:MAG TPA: VTT domain-containing protein [Cyclobacteriaceae bacterium]